MNSIHRLDWDSLFFGYEVGRLNIPSDEAFEYSEFKVESSKFKLVYIYSDFILPANQGLSLYDEKVTFSQKIYFDALKLSSIRNNNSISISSFNRSSDDLNKLQELALQSGIYSRFKLDPNFKNNEYKRLYLEWIDNSINGNIAFDTIVAKIKGKIVGFTTVGEKNKNLADIGLVAVDKNSRGEGIGTALIHEILHRAAHSGFKEIQVVTQLVNQAAIKLYEKTNFYKTNLTYIYHVWNHDTL